MGLHRRSYVMKRIFMLDSWGDFYECIEGIFGQRNAVALSLENERSQNRGAFFNVVHARYASPNANIPARNFATIRLTCHPRTADVVAPARSLQWLIPVGEAPMVQ